jgi:hypothetical protein
MIEPKSSCTCLLHVILRRCPVSQPIHLSDDENVPPIQVWKFLSVDRRFQIMRLLAQLAFNLVLAQSEPISTLPEVPHALPDQSSKNQI